MREKRASDKLKRQQAAISQTISEIIIEEVAIDEVEVEVEECVACYEKCDEKTHCGHILCTDCFYKIIPSNNVRPCPMCRRPLPPPDDGRERTSLRTNEIRRQRSLLLHDVVDEDRVYTLEEILHTRAFLRRRFM